MNFDEILCHIGGFGKFQKILYIWICLPQIFLVFHMLVNIFTGAVPPHFCRSTWPSAAVNFSFLTIPSNLSCSVPSNHSSGVSLDDGGPAESCHGGWEYSNQTFQSTIVTEVSYSIQFGLCQLFPERLLFHCCETDVFNMRTHAVQECEGAT